MCSVLSFQLIAYSRVILGSYWDNIRVILGVYWGNIRVIQL